MSDIVESAARSLMNDNVLWLISVGAVVFVGVVICGAIKLAHWMFDEDDETADIADVDPIEELRCAEDDLSRVLQNAMLGENSECVQDGCHGLLSCDEVTELQEAMRTVHRIATYAEERRRDQYADPDAPPPRKAHA